MDSSTINQTLFKAMCSAVAKMEWELLRPATLSGRSLGDQHTSKSLRLLPPAPKDASTSSILGALALWPIDLWPAPPSKGFDAAGWFAYFRRCGECNELHFVFPMGSIRGTRDETLSRLTLPFECPHCMMLSGARRPRDLKRVVYVGEIKASGRVVMNFIFTCKKCLGGHLSPFLRMDSIPRHCVRCGGGTKRAKAGVKSRRPQSSLDIHLRRSGR